VCDMCKFISTHVCGWVAALGGLVAVGRWGGCVKCPREKRKLWFVLSCVSLVSPTVPPTAFFRRAAVFVAVVVYGMWMWMCGFSFALVSRSFARARGPLI